MKRSISVFLFIIVVSHVYGQMKTLPFTWTEGQIRISIQGIFLATDETKEGFIGEDEKQYKLLITYQNTAKKDYESSNGIGVGYLKLKTNKGNVYNPKYVGGSNAPDLRPEGSFTTNNYCVALLGIVWVGS